LTRFLIEEENIFYEFFSAVREDGILVTVLVWNAAVEDDPNSFRVVFRSEVGDDDQITGTDVG